MSLNDTFPATTLTGLRLAVLKAAIEAAPNTGTGRNPDLILDLAGRFEEWIRRPSGSGADSLAASEIANGESPAGTG